MSGLQQALSTLSNYILKKTLGTRIAKKQGPWIELMIVTIPTCLIIYKFSNSLKEPDALKCRVFVDPF